MYPVNVLKKIVISKMKNFDILTLFSLRLRMGIIDIEFCHVCFNMLTLIC